MVPARRLTNVVQDTVTGMLLAGVGNIDGRQKRNFFVVDGSTPRLRRACLIPCGRDDTGASGRGLTTRKDIAILLINHHVRTRASSCGD